MITSLIPDYHREIVHRSGYSHGDINCLNENLDPIFLEKVTVDCCDPDETLRGTKDCLSDIKIYRGEVKKFTGEYQKFKISIAVN